MSHETTWLVRLPKTGIERLLADIDAAASRVSLALPGDRTDVVRFEALATELERQAMAAFTMGADAIEQPDLPTGPNSRAFYDADTSEVAAAAPWFAAGDIAVELRCPFGIGPTPVAERRPVRGPAEVWRALDDHGSELDGSRAVEQRFRDQIEAALNGIDPGAAIRPSGINNQVLTNSLRSYVARTEQPPCAVPVEYRDGSLGPEFPLRCLDLRDDDPPSTWSEYHFAMLSIRHTEMDSEVDGAWLRNAEISQPRPVGETDELAYRQSLDQFARLTEARPAIVYMYQTGLEAAVLGVYRAAVQHLSVRPGSLAVVPMFYRAPRPDIACAHRYVDQAEFVEGETWWA